MECSPEPSLLWVWTAGKQAFRSAAWHNFAWQAVGGGHVTDNLSPLNDFEKVD